MLHELAGFALSRYLPDNVLAGLLTGSYKLYGGVVRNNAGQIVAHLVSSTGGSSLIPISAITAPLNMAFSGVNTYQLYRIGGDVTRLGAAVSDIGTNVSSLLGLAQASIAISGLTLAVSSAGFLFLNRKLGQIDKKLAEVAKDVKSIKRFLELQERARLVAALKNIKDLKHTDNQYTKNRMLMYSKQTLWEIHEKYKLMLTGDEFKNELLPAEEYFVATAIGYSLCSAELGQHLLAKDDLADSYDIWHKAAKSFVVEKVIRGDPERLLEKRYASHIKCEEIAGWMDFAEDGARGFDRLDELRGKPSWFSVDINRALDPVEARAIAVARKLVQRDRVLKGYIDQYAYYASVKKKPSEVQDYIDGLPQEKQIDGCYLFLSNDQVASGKSAG